MSTPVSVDPGIMRLKQTVQPHTRYEEQDAFPTTLPSCNACRIGHQAHQSSFIFLYVMHWSTALPFAPILILNTSTEGRNGLNTSSNLKRPTIYHDLHTEWCLWAYYINSFAIFAHQVSIYVHIYFPLVADRPWGPPSLLYNGYRVFP